MQFLGGAHLCAASSAGHSETGMQTACGRMRSTDMHYCAQACKGFGSMLLLPYFIAGYKELEQLRWQAAKWSAQAC